MVRAGHRSRRAGAILARAPEERTVGAAHSRGVILSKCALNPVFLYTCCMSSDDSETIRAPIALISRDEGLFARVAQAVKALGEDCVRASGAAEAAGAPLVILDLDPLRGGGACVDFDDAGPPLVLVLPERPADYDFYSCIGARIYGFLRRECSRSEAEAVLVAAIGRSEEARHFRAESRRFKAFADSSPDLLIVIDEEGRYREIFSADEALLLSKPERMRGRTIHELFPAELAESPQALIVRATSGQMGGMIEYELEVIGGKRWFEGRAAPAGLGPDGKRLAMYEARDITERKAAEAALRKALDEKNMLLRELQHRVKNNLAMISSLVSLEADRLTREEDREAFERVQGRIRAMALIYDMLYRSEDVLDVELSTYLKSLFDSFRESYLEGLGGGVELVEELEPARLDLKRAIPLGIIVTELLTNAVKYAFPGGRSGRISASLRVEGGVALVAIEDDGVGIAGAEREEGSTGTGLRLVDLLSDQIEGRLTRGTGPGGRGLRCELALRLAPPED